MEPLRFLDTDVSGAPVPGWYPSTIVTACWRQSARNNRMVYLVHALESVPPAFSRISDCFVLEGASSRGLAYARKRLVAVFRACGRTPRSGEEINPGDLCGSQIEVKVAHETWKDQTRLTVVGYREHAQDQDREGSPGGPDPRPADSQGNAQPEDSDV